MYDGKHSITFGSGEIVDGILEGENTWTAWHLIPSSRPTMSMPSAQNKFVEIAGMNGSYDISDYLTPNITFADRSGNFDFVVDNDHEDWLTIYRKISTYLHGQPMKMILADDPEWYYVGRFSVDTWKSDAIRSSISITYRVSPFKYSVYSAFVDNVVWDLFCFERDMDWSLLYHVEVSADNPKTFIIDPYGVWDQLQAKLISGTPVTFTYNGQSFVAQNPGDTVTLTSGSRDGGKDLEISTTRSAVVDIGWQKISL